MNVVVCECIVVAHKQKCREAATRECVKCGAKLCHGCANNHHAHKETQPYTAPALTTPPSRTPTVPPGTRFIVCARSPYIGWHGAVVGEGSQNGWLEVKFDNDIGVVEIPIDALGVE